MRTAIYLYQSFRCQGTQPQPALNSRRPARFRLILTSQILTPYLPEPFHQIHLLSNQLAPEPVPRDTQPVAIRQTSSDNYPIPETERLPHSKYYSLNEEVSSVKTRTTIHPEPNSEVEVETSMEGETPSESQGIIPAYEELDTSMNANRLKLLLQKHRSSCRLVIPSPGERCHYFDNFEPDQAIPSAVFSATFFRMGLSIPLHPFIHDIITYYDISPLQMTPNAYRMAMCMYILYDQQFEKKMSARNRKGMSMIVMTAQFTEPNSTDFPVKIPSKTALKGHSLERAQEALRLSAELGDGASLLTDQNLKRCGFLSNERSTNLVPTEDSEAGASNRIDMDSGVPSFVNKTASYDDLFGDEEKDLVPIEATPISRMKSTTVLGPKYRRRGG
ncbi:hypothetical protein POM88_011197 [Heracleum sosnowskyi]|uniref:Transposase (putative) gypsy type domain-containing protein n=1 Tax=Heracleum sosnowskyi TaxID=360622 RepID=A0AAD8IWJ5_9APIA|nr:hypothetical protein POM88_011197 [Heracleum sosnowskyi]